jgi:hypothetical protein
MRRSAEVSGLFGHRRCSPLRPAGHGSIAGFDALAALKNMISLLIVVRRVAALD